MKNHTWLLLLYSLPTRSNTARVNLWRKLKKVGAIQLKTSAYLLPDNPMQYERFQWLSTQIRDLGGEATLIKAAEVEGLTPPQIVQLFNDARETDYKELIETGREALAERTRRKESWLAAEIEKTQRRFNEIRKIDYFECPAASDVQMFLHRMEKLLKGKQPENRSLIKLNRARFAGKTWLTRPRPGIDRVGSAWLIRKFIDPKATFVFGKEPGKDPNTFPFDMANVEFSHHGEDCTFETLVKRFGIENTAVRKIAEMVHDADLEDGKFQRNECMGINAVLLGWARVGMSDEELLTRGGQCFEGLYEQLR